MKFQTRRFLPTHHDIHRLNGCPGSALHQIVDGADHDQAVAVGSFAKPISQ